MIKTVSLKTAKLLKEAGFPQETALFYRVDEFGNVFERNANEDPLKMQKVLGTNIYYAKPTIDELLEELPESLIQDGYLAMMKIIRTPSKEYFVTYQSSREDRGTVENESLPEALAQMWLWLKKEKLI